MTRPTVTLWWSDREVEVDPDDVDGLARTIANALGDNSHDWAVPYGLDRRVRDALQGARGASEGQVRMVLAAIGRPWVVQ